jgi:hypothetical protein
MATQRARHHDTDGNAQPVLIWRQRGFYSFLEVTRHDSRGLDEASHDVGDMAAVVGHDGRVRLAIEAQSGSFR